MVKMIASLFMDGIRTKWRIPKAFRISLILIAQIAFVFLCSCCVWLCINKLLPYADVVAGTGQEIIHVCLSP